MAELAQSRDAFIPSVSFGSGLPAFPEVGFTGSLPTIWDSTIQSLVFSMPQIQYIHAARAGPEGRTTGAEGCAGAGGAGCFRPPTSSWTRSTGNSRPRANRSRMRRGLVEIEQQRAEAGVDPLSTLLQAQLTAAQLKLNRLHLETRAATLSKQLADTYRTARGFNHARPREHSRDSGGHRRSGRRRPRLALNRRRY